MQIHAFVNKADKSDLAGNTSFDRVVPLQTPDCDQENPEVGGHDGLLDPLVHEQSGGNGQPPPGDLIDPNISMSDGRVAAVLGEQLQEALDDKQKLADELQIERVRNSQLENQVALGIDIVKLHSKSLD